MSNFARGMFMASCHNQKYWDHTPYLGLGPSAHSFDGRARRWWNHRSLEDYIASLEADRSPLAGEEHLTPEELRLEALSLGLRTRRGIPLKTFHQRLDEDLRAERSPVLSRLHADGLVLVEDGWLRPTPSGLAVADRLSAALA